MCEPWPTSKESARRDSRPLAANAPSSAGPPNLSPVIRANSGEITPKDREANIVIEGALLHGIRRS